MNWIRNIAQFISIFDFRITQGDEAMINQQLEELKSKNLVREMENGKVVRHVLEDDKTGVKWCLPYTGRRAIY